MKIVIINPPIREHEAPQHFPSGLGYIAQVTREAGHDVKVLDINGLRINRNEVVRYLKESDAQAFLIGGLITVYKYVKWLAEEIKKYHPNIWIIAGNSLASSAPEIVLRNTKIDYLVIGEGELTIVELLNKLAKKTKASKLKSVKGIAYKLKNKVVITKPRERIDNLNKLPFPAWDLFPMKVYIRDPILLPGLENLSDNSINIICGRACPYHCTYCYHVFGYQNKIRSPDNVLKEIKYLKEKFKIKAVYFSDDLFMINHEWVREFCEKLIKSKMDIIWGTTGRVNMVTPEILKIMKRAGCKVIQFGIESGSQRMLNIMKKGVTVEQASKAIKLTRKAGITVSTSFMMGFPEETKETLEETIKFCIDNDIHLVSIFFVTPYPGTALYEQVKKMGLIKDEEEYISKLGDATELTINLTKWSDEELLELRNYVIKKIRKAYFRKHKIQYVKWIIKKQEWYLKYLKTKGLRAFLNEARKKAISIIKK